MDGILSASMRRTAVFDCSVGAIFQHCFAYSGLYTSEYGPIWVDFGLSDTTPRLAPLLFEGLWLIQRQWL